MKMLFLPTLIASFFVILWLIVFPSEFFDALMFRYRDSKFDSFMCVVLWIFVIGFAHGFVLLARYLEKLS